MALKAWYNGEEGIVAEPGDLILHLGKKWVVHAPAHNRMRVIAKRTCTEGVDRTLLAWADNCTLLERGSP